MFSSKKSHLKEICITVVAILGAVVSISISIILSHYDDHAATPSDCIVVFGAAVVDNDTPSHALYDRTMTGIKLYQQGYADHCIIFSGGRTAPRKIHEADMMRLIARKNGIPEDAIIRDYDGTNTKATITNLVPGKRYILVSNDFHLARIALFAHRAGLDFQTHRATYHAGRYRKEPFFFFREVAALLYYGACPSCSR